MRSIDAKWQRAQRYFDEGNITSARAAMESILASDPDQPHAHVMLGGIAWKADQVRKGTAHALAAMRCRLDTPEFVCDVIAALASVGETTAVHDLLAHPLLAYMPVTVPVLMRLSGLAQGNGEHGRALACLERARSLGTGGAQFLEYLSVQLVFNGQLDKAELTLEECVRLDPTLGRAALMLSRLKPQSAQHNHLANINAALARIERGSVQHATLLFARYKELEDLQHYEEAWAALVEANRVMHARRPHDPDAEAASIQRLIDVTANVDPPQVAANRDGPKPIFIVGMPRSGTTVLDRIISNHSAVADAGELDDFGNQLRWSVDHMSPQLLDETALARLQDVDFVNLGQRYLHQTQWRAGDKAYYVDKLPANWLLAGLLARALPHAPILHMVRDPMDLCFSNWRAMLGDSYPYSYEINALARHHAAYQKLMAHWRRVCPGRILDVSYQDLVNQPERVARRVLEFCGLSFEQGCVDVTRNAQQLATLSMVQAREPIDRRGVGAWRRYSGQLEPLRAQLVAM
jgi:tetratricopeptide (TPR) repeat protein